MSSPVDRERRGDRGAGRPPPRLFWDEALQEGREIALEGPAARYLLTVLRLGVGARALLFNSRDGEWAAEIVAAGKRGGTLRLLTQTRPPETTPDLTLLFAPLKKAKTEFLVEKATELGCRALQPVITARTQPGGLHLERLRTLIIEAAEQCERTALTRLAEPAPLAAALSGLEPDRPLFFCDERRDAPPMQRVVQDSERGAGKGAVLIGSEGGFDDAESAMLRERPGVFPVSLGPRVLRAETAAAAAISLWQAAAGDWG